MQKTRMIQNATIIALGIAIIIMSVGYAAYDSTLKVTGTAKVQDAKWSVHFDTPTVVKAAKAVDSTTDPYNVPVQITDTGKTQVTFKVLMALDDEYEVKIPIVNDGTFNAKLDSFTLTGKKAGSALTIATGASAYDGAVLDYTATIDGSAITANATSTNVDADDSKDLVINIKTAQPAAEADLVGNVGVEYEFVLTLNYNQRTA